MRRNSLPKAWIVLGQQAPAAVFLPAICDIAR
jgi:hypothetical protein